MISRWKYFESLETCDYYCPFVYAIELCLFNISCS